MADDLLNAPDTLRPSAPAEDGIIDQLRSENDVLRIELAAAQQVASDAQRERDAALKDAHEQSEVAGEVHRHAVDAL